MAIIPNSVAMTGGITFIVDHTTGFNSFTATAMEEAQIRSAPIASSLTSVTPPTTLPPTTPATWAPPVGVVPYLPPSPPSHRLFHHHHRTPHQPLPLSPPPPRPSLPLPSPPPRSPPSPSGAAHHRAPTTAAATSTMRRERERERRRRRRGSPRGGVGVEGGGEAHRGTHGVKNSSNDVDGGYGGSGKFRQPVALV
ncbi:lysine-rich arabinogalactan protein 19-like [Sorghum bicolor]|uniref:lysine-rich arabinogalactan protein 19-like n=1 Tax=Sorghum bicolor TaxID=4558 RepID=UPI000B426CD6|nr:lysine-rich arabinogalactan protein 19-like [Sorghum bicolor]|eukprot:XP_021309020.1 lysine-rich arabinogalactan protein 19-like [Sorghum bicolor]